MRPKLAAAIRIHSEKYDLGDLEASALICCETISTRQKKVLFGSKTEVYITGIILTPQWLVWAAGKEGESPAAFSARLRDIRVQDYEKSDMFKMIQDTSLNIFGLLTGAKRHGVSFIGLGSEALGQRFREILREEIAKE
jgi:hypothetical protein